MLIAATDVKVPRKHFLNQKEVIELSSLSRSTLERLERQCPPGMPPARRFGLRCKRYLLSDIQAWLDGTWIPQVMSHD